jgi:hypothetical protein
VDRDAYLLTLCRYVERNPVAAHLVARVGDWPWSSYRAHLGEVAAPSWLDTEGLLGYVLGRPVRTAADRRSACRRYAELVDDPAAGVAAGVAEGDPSFWGRALRQQIYLGDEAFVARMQARAASTRLASAEVPAAQRKPMTATPAQALAASMAQGAGRAQALRMAYRDHGHTMTALAKAAGLSVSRVSRLIAQAESQP